MSEDENFSTCRGQYQSANITSEEQEHEANDSIIQKVKSRVSSILPQTFSKWFSPTSNSDENRNGNIRRRRCEDDSLNDSDLDGSQNDQCNNEIMPPNKKSRLNCDEKIITREHYINKVRGNQFSSSTPMLDIRGRKELHSENYIQPVFISPPNKNIRPMNDIEEETDIIEVVPKLQLRSGQNKKNLNVSSMSTRFPNDQYKRSGINFTGSFISNSVEKRKTQIASDEDVDEECENEEIEDDEDEIEEDDEEENNHRNTKVRTIEKSNISNGISNPNVIITRNENQDTASESGESQCSSLGQQQLINRIKSADLLYKAKNSMLNQSKHCTTNGFNFYSHLEGKKSLFSSKNMHSVLNNSTMSLTSLNRRQQFNASLYGSTSALSDSRLLNTSSPFYKGRTTYGGASAYGNSFMSSSARQIRLTPTLIRPSSSLSNVSNSSQDANSTNIGTFDKNSLRNGSNNTAISSTAKRILELMDQFTTPLNDARKMAESLKNSQVNVNKKRFTESDYITSKGSNAGIRLQKPRTPYSRPQEVINKQNDCVLPPVNELQVPSMAQLLQLKTLQANTEKNRELATSNKKSILNQRTDYKTSNHSGKIKNKITSTRPSKNMNETEHLETVNLPDIPLPLMKSIPKIDIPLQTKKSMQNDTHKAIKQASSNVSGNSSQRSVLGNFNINNTATMNYKFSAPIKVNYSDDNNNKSVNSTNNFKFSRPGTIDSYKNNHQTVLDNVKKLDENNIKEQSVKTIQFGNKTESEILNEKPFLSGTAKPAPQLKSGSVLDVLSKSKTIETKTSIVDVSTNSKPVEKSNIGFGDAFKKPANQWECSACMIRNDESRDKCLACETLRKKDSTKNIFSINTPIVPKSSSLSEQFKVNPNTWECGSCMIRNKNECSKCIACNSLRTGGVKTDISSKNNDSKQISDSKMIESNKIIDTGFKKIVAQQNAKWECSSCMTRNDSDRLKCVCCEQVKPGLNSSKEKSNSSFGTPANKLDTGFKQIVAQQNAKWECSACMTRNDNNRLKCICCEQTKPGSNSSTGSTSFSFGAAANKFSFGFPKSNENLTNKTEEKSDSKNENISTSNSNSGFKFEPLPKNPSSITCTLPVATNTFSFGVNSSNLTTENKLSEKTDVKETTNPVSSSEFSFGFSKTTPSTPKQIGTTASFPAPKLNTSTLGTSMPEEVKKTSEKTNFVFGSATSKQDETDSKTKTFSFGSPITSTSSSFIKPVTNSVVSTSSTTLPTTGFSFGSPQQKDSSNVLKPVNSNFTFGSASTSTSAITSVTTTSSTAPTIPAPSTNFIFGSTNKTTTAVTTTTSSLFGVSASTSVTSSTTSNSAMLKTSSATSPPVTTWSSVFGSPSSLGTQKISPMNNTNSSIGSGFGNINNNSEQGSKTTLSTTNQIPNNNIFQFGSNASSSNNNNNNNNKKPEASAPIFGSPPSNNAPNNKQFGFGSSSEMAQPIFCSNNNTTAATPFVFGTQKSSNDSNINPTTNTASNSGTLTNTNSIFGTSNNTFGSSSTFGSSTFGSQQSTTPVFGQSASVPNNNLFSNNNVQQQQQKPATNFSSPTSSNLFGSSSTIAPASSPFNSSSTNAGTFGMGATTTPTFGNTSSAPPSFGNTTMPPTFGSPSNNNVNFAMPTQDQAKKPADTLFNFGGATQNTQPSGGFSFGNNSNNNTTKPAFNFSAQTTPSFNFTGSTEANTSQPFQFGASSNTATIPTVFNFGNTENPPSNNAPFTFNASTPTTNIFAPTPTQQGQSTVLQARRKVRAAVRRNQPR